MALINGKCTAACVDGRSCWHKECEIVKETSASAMYITLHPINLISDKLINKVIDKPTYKQLGYNSLKKIVVSTAKKAGITGAGAKADGDNKATPTEDKEDKTQIPLFNSSTSALDSLSNLAGGGDVFKDVQTAFQTTTV